MKGRHPPTKVLISYLDDEDDLRLLRRREAYGRLVLLAEPSQKSHAERILVQETAPHGATADALTLKPVVEIVTLPEHDPPARARCLEETIDAYHGHDVTVHVGGADATTTAHALIVVFRRGLRAVIVQTGRHTVLPTLHGARVQELFDATEAALLCALVPHTPGADSARLIAQLGFERNAGERALRNLRTHGMVTFDIIDGQAHPRLTRRARSIVPHL